jgi:hypothetical protein
MSERLDVRRTSKLFIGGAFPRSESGRTLEVRGHDGAFLANAARASRKDVRDAVVAARAAQPRPPRRRSPPPSTAGSGTPAGPTSSRRSRAA